MVPNLHQFAVLAMLLAWSIPLVAIWVRYDRLRHGKVLLLAIMLWPLSLVDELIRAFDPQLNFVFLARVFQFIAPLLMALLYFSVHQMTLENPLKSKVPYLAPSLVVLVAELPFLMTTGQSKAELLLSPPVGNLVQYWPTYLAYFFSGVAILWMGIQTTTLIREYEAHLPEQVVDRGLYKMPAAMGLFGGIITVSCGVIIITVLAAIGLFQYPQWQSVINLLYAGLFWLLLVLLVQRRRISPSPLNYAVLEHPSYSPQVLQKALREAEHAVIKQRAYKKIGLRIKHFASQAGIDPTVLAVATKQIQNRNFSAFIYHYRLEYAKKVLMRSDTKVSSVAKRLGFSSEKFLSDMFIKYIDKMGHSAHHPDEDKLFSVGSERR